MGQLVKNLPVMQETWFDSWVGKIPWRSKRLFALVFLPREFHGLYSPWGCRELDTTERLSFFHNNLYLFLIEQSLIIRQSVSGLP